MERSLQFVLAMLLVLLLQVLLGNAAVLFPDETEAIEDFGPMEDDIMYTPEQEAFMRGERKSIPTLSKRWPEVYGFPFISYSFNDDIVNKTAIKRAISHWEEHTCLKFKEVTSDYSGNHVYFLRHVSRCNSYIGMISSGGGQLINIADWCEISFINLLHELGHAIGLFHEQSRSDRNSYVNINTENVKDAFVSNFQQAIDNNYSVPYDYNSNMHYFSKAFSKNGKITIATTDPRSQSIINRPSGLSHMDKLLVNKMYSCIQKNLVRCGISKDPCQNNGYTGKNCNCLCPYGTTGTHCETLNASHNDEYLSSYSVKVTTQGTISSPDYPNPTQSGESYTKWIVAPECKRIKLTFNEFSSSCLEMVEIRTSNMFDGEWYCGSNLTAGDTFISDSNTMIIFSYRNLGNVKWSADVTFEDNPNCAITTTTSTTTTSTTRITHDPITTTTPTTIQPVVTCDTIDLENGVTAFKSPNYPSQYQNDATCVHESNSTEPGIVYFFFTAFSVGQGDYLLLEHPYGPPTKLDRTRLLPFIMKFPSYFRATFVSDNSATSRGFYVKYGTRKETCHQTVQVTGLGSVKSKGYPWFHWVKTICEWKFTTSPGSCIKLNIYLNRVTRLGSYVAVDQTPGDTVVYDSSSIKHYRGTNQIIKVVSTSNEISVFYLGHVIDKGIKVTYEKI